MIPLLQSHSSEVAEICRRFHVRQLDVFGSAARGGDFDPGKSDIDLLVTYDPAVPRPGLAGYFGLREALSSLLGRPVDLVMEGAVRNPYIRADIEQARERLYAA